MTTVALVSCAAGKLTTVANAADLYDSPLFGLARQFAEKRCDRWFILSAKHHLLRPDILVEPYDLTLNNMGVAERRQWAEFVYQELKKVLKPRDKMVILAGGKYREFLVPKLEQAGISVEIPMEHLPIGKQLKWLKENAS